MINIQVKEIREKLAMTQQDFAKYLGVSFATVNRWENNRKKPSALATEKLLAALARSEKELRGKKK